MSKSDEENKFVFSSHFIAEDNTCNKPCDLSLDYYCWGECSHCKIVAKDLAVCSPP